MTIEQHTDEHEKRENTCSAIANRDWDRELQAEGGRGTKAYLRKLETLMALREVQT